MPPIEDLAHLVRYELLEDAPLGGGGCGEVWKAKDCLTNDIVAIKTLRVFTGADRERARRSFTLEAVAAARLARMCKHVLPVVDFGETNETLYLVAPWIDGNVNGPDISGLIGRCTMGTARRIVLQAGAALAAAHQHGVVHSDVAPWNILYDGAADRYLLADFGLLKLHESSLITEASGSLLSGGRLAFLPRYVHRDLGSVSGATDVFALAVTFWVLVSGNKALSHDEKVPGVVEVQHSGKDAPDGLRQLLVRFVEEHSAQDDIDSFLENVRNLPTR